MEELRKSKRIKKKNGTNHSTFNSETENPLLNGLILENIFGYLKGQNTATATIAHYRVVCKTWDQEIAKFLRKEIQIDLTKLLTPYPAGLGWISLQDNLEKPFYYDVPYPETRQFENILVVIDSCDKLKSQNWIDWFRIMGLQVKRLTFSSPFTCLCQNHIMERILKEWCPNLVQLELRDVKRVTGLFFVSSFLQNSTSLICKDLKHLSISVDRADNAFFLCREQANVSNHLQVLRANITQLCLTLSNRKLVETIYNHGLSSIHQTPFSDIVNTSANNEILPKSISENIKETDGGIVGQLMKEVNVEKLSINRFNKLSDCEMLATFFHIRQNLWRSSLKNLELDEFLSRSLQQLHIIAQVKFPLCRIKFSEIHSKRYNQEMSRFLSYFSNTLEHLEISGDCVQKKVLRKPVKLNLPFLPKLKTLKHENIVSCGLLLHNLLENAPNLETCHLKHSLTTDWNGDKFFGDSTEVSCAAMKDLKVVARISGSQAVLLLNNFPNLVQIELILNRLDVSALGFFEQLGMSKVKRLKIGFLFYENEFITTHGKCTAASIWNPGNIQGLESLELNNLSKGRLHLTSKPFSVGKLRSLKLINFRFCKDEEQEFLHSSSHIPCVEIINT